VSDSPEGNAQVQRGVVSAVGAIGLATLASRVLGYLRDMVVAHAFGAGPVTDAFLVAFRIPNLLRRLLGEGALSTAVIPVFTETLTRGGPTAFGRLARATTGAAIVVLCVVSALGILLSHQVVAVMAPGWRADTGLFKNVRIYERLQLQLRGEAYNVFNHSNPDGVTVASVVNGYNPTTGVTSYSSTAGNVTSYRDKRILQLGAKIVF